MSFSFSDVLIFSDACSINIGSSVLLTGGRYSLNRVSEYSETGYVRDLPRLLQGRYRHGCSYFENEEGTKVDIDSNSSRVIIFQTFLVAGGYNNDNDLSSTELLRTNAVSWILTGDLPSPRHGLRGANIDQRVIMTGGVHGDGLDEVLEYKPNTREWSLVGQMLARRSYHGVSVVSAGDIGMFCSD